MPLLYQSDLDGEPRAKGRRDMGSDELYLGLALSYPRPGRAGEWNGVRARGARPGERVFFFLGSGLGTTGFGFGACPALTLELANACFLGDMRASASGEATYGSNVPSFLGGVGIALQAIGFDTASPAQGCSSSNAFPFTFP